MLLLATAHLAAAGLLAWIDYRVSRDPGRRLAVFFGSACLVWLPVVSLAPFAAFGCLGNMNLEAERAEVSGDRKPVRRWAAAFLATGAATVALLLWLAYVWIAGGAYA